jgi:hypothetical protein
VLVATNQAGRVVMKAQLVKNGERLVGGDGRGVAIVVFGGGWNAQKVSLRRCVHGCFVSFAEILISLAESGETSVHKVTTLPYKFVLFFPPNLDPFLFCIEKLWDIPRDKPRK